MHKMKVGFGWIPGPLCLDLKTANQGGSSCGPCFHLLLQRGHDGQLHPESHQPGAQQVLFGLGWVAMLRTFHQVRHSLRDLQRIWKHHWIPCARDQEANCFGKFSEGLNQHTVPVKLDHFQGHSKMVRFSYHWFCAPVK